MQAETLNAQAPHFAAKIQLAQSSTKPETKGGEQQGNPGMNKPGSTKGGSMEKGSMNKDSMKGGDATHTPSGMKKDERNGEKQGTQGHTK
jgi:hypothetical protein